MCTNQLLSITHQVCKSPDNSQEVRSVFLGIFKVFGKVWHKDIIFNLKENGIPGNLLSTFSEFFKPRKQRVVLNSQLSSWSNIKAGTPQDYILDSLLFLIYITIFQRDSQQAADSLLMMLAGNMDLSVTNSN